MPTDIHRHDVRRLVEAGAQLLEVLPSEEYAEEHLPGAVNVPLKQLNAEAASKLRCDQPVIVYCHDYQ